MSISHRPTPTTSSATLQSTAYQMRVRQVTHCSINILRACSGRKVVDNLFIGVSKGTGRKTPKLKANISKGAVEVDGTWGYVHVIGRVKRLFRRL